MKYLSKRFISILLSFVFFAGALVLYVNFIKPVYQEIKSDQGKLAAMQQKSMEYKEVFGKLKQVLASIKQSPDLQSRISIAFPLSSNVGNSMNQITAVALANGLAITSIDISDAPVIPAVAAEPGAVTLVKGVGVLRNAIRVSGSYAQIRTFLQGVESGVRISSIKAVKFDKAPNIPGDVINATVEIETYYQIN